MNPRKAAELNRMAFRYTTNGELARAVPPLHQAHWMCREKLGPNHPATQKTVRYLANVYQVALNAPAPPATIASQKHFYQDALTTGGPASANSQTASHLYGNVDSPYGGPPHVSAEMYYRAAVTLREQIASKPAHDVQTEVVPVLAQALRSAPSAKERLDLVKAIASLGPAARTAVPLLTDRLKNSQDPIEVKEVLLALKEIGPAARAAVPTLVALADHSEPSPKKPGTHRTVRAFSMRATSLPKEARDVGLATAKEQQVRQTLTCLEGPEGRCGIDDRAGCFSVQALRQSTRFIRALAQRKHIEVLFETVQAGPEMGNHLPKDGPQPDRLKAMGERAIYVVFTPQSNVFEIHVSAALRRDGITPQKLSKRLLECCCDKPLDKALDESIRLVAEVAAKK
jgi:hypothetical protein